MIARANVKHLPIADNSIDLVFTDPPYPREFLPCYGWLADEAMRVLKPGGFVLAMCGGLLLNKIFRTFDDSGLTYFYEFQHKSNGDAPTVWKHYENATPYPVVARAKPIIVYSKGTGRPRISGVHNLFDTGNGWSEGKSFHHWGQDVASARYYIDCFSAPGDLVLDPFIGGGTTLIACELIGRRCVAMDIDPAALATTKARRAGEFLPRAVTLFDMESA